MINKIRELRARFNMSQEELAKQAGITRQTVASYESGERVPPGDTMIKIAKIFNMPAESIFFADDVRRD